MVKISDSQTSNILTYVKYIYLLFFFGLLSGLFYPIITKHYPDKPFTGIMILFAGLMGLLLIYKASKVEDQKKKFKYILIGGIIITGGLFFIIAGTGSLG